MRALLIMVAVAGLVGCQKPQKSLPEPLHSKEIVVVTHNAAFAESMPRVVGMKDGRIDSDRRGDTARVLRRPADAAAPAAPPPE